MTKFEIITQLEDLARDAKGRIDPEDPEDVFWKDFKALTEAIRILKEARHGKWVRRDTGCQNRMAFRGLHPGLKTVQVV